MDGVSPHLESDKHMERRITQFLGEFRIMVPGLAALLGFQLTSAYSSAWDRLPFENKILNYAAVMCTMLALVFVLIPALYHRGMREIEENDRFLRFAARYFGFGLIAFGTGLTITMYLQAFRVFGHRNPSLLGALIFALILLGLWVAIPQRRIKRILRDGGDDSGSRQHRLPVVAADKGTQGAAGRQL